MFTEYYGDPDVTSAAFDAEGYFDTGDLVALLPDGAIRFVSRAKDMLKVGGESVAAAEIERVLCAVPQVREAAVVALPDPAYGEVPVAFITVGLNVDAPAATVDALARCARDLANFKIPRSVHVLDELPTAAMNKIAKGKLRELAVALDQR
jgi:crotonobetaine/carnitine-CoA ligase